MSSHRTPSEAAPSTEKSGDFGRSLVSLLLVVHLFCLAVALSSNLAPSPLQTRLIEVLGPYVQLLNIDLNYTPYYLTHETSLDTDHRIEVLAQGADTPIETADSPTQEAWYVLPDVGLRGGDRRHRYQRLAKVMDVYADREELSGQIAERLVIHFLSQREIVPVQVRCRRLELQTPESLRPDSTAPQDPFDPSYFRTVYDARVVVLPSGAIFLNRIEQAGQAAPPGTSQE